MEPDRFLLGGGFGAATEADLFSPLDTSIFGDRRLLICLENPEPGESAYVLTLGGSL